MTHEAIDPVTTQPNTQPTIPTIADLLPARIRAWVYALLGIWIPVFGIWAASGAPPAIIGYVTAGLGGTGFLLSASNVPRRV